MGEDLLCACEGPTFSKILNELNKVNNGTLVRQNIISQIENITNSKVILYVSAFNHPLASISYDDIMPYEDMLQSIGNVETINLIIHSPGGDPNAAEKIVKMTRNYCKNFKVIVPNSAKSAATLIALGADEIMMGYLSELGPIDPQITYKLPNGQLVMRPSQTIIDTFEKIKDEINREGRLLPAYLPILNNYDIALVDFCEKANKRAQELAESLLNEYMLKDDPYKAKQIAGYLSDGGRHLSHSKIIDRQEAQKLGLNINSIEKEDQLWKLIWELYCRTEVLLRASKSIKLFESATNSLLQNGAGNN